MSPTKTTPRRTSARAQSPAVPREERRVVHDASWDFYDRLSDAIETRSIRMAFDGKDIEIMTLGGGHEGIGGLLRQFIDLVMDGIEVDCIAVGSTTWKRAEIERGIEADQSYVFDPSKIQVCRSALVRNSNNIDDYPNPDLAAEIDISPPKIDRPGIYAALKVSELWRRDQDGAITIEQLGDDGQYLAAKLSRFLHVRPEEVAHWLEMGASTERGVWRRRLKEWIAKEVKPRVEHA
jgi:Uma2 family endonuclease